MAQYVLTWTVALGIHDKAINTFSLKRNSAKDMSIKVAKIRVDNAKPKVAIHIPTTHINQCKNKAFGRKVFLSREMNSKISENILRLLLHYIYLSKNSNYKKYKVKMKCCVCICIQVCVGCACTLKQVRGLCLLYSSMPYSFYETKQFIFISFALLFLPACMSMSECQILELERVVSCPCGCWKLNLSSLDSP